MLLGYHFVFHVLLEALVLVVFQHALFAQLVNILILKVPLLVYFAKPACMHLQLVCQFVVLLYQGLTAMMVNTLSLVMPVNILPLHQVHPAYLVHKDILQPRRAPPCVLFVSLVHTPYLQDLLLASMPLKAQFLLEV